MNVPKQIELLEDLEQWRVTVKKLLKEKAPGNVLAAREAIAWLKTELRRYNIEVQDMYGDFAGEGEE